jgi:MFS family permease
MNAKRKLESRIRGWFPQEAKLSPKINIQPSFSHPKAKNVLTYGRIGGILALLMAIGAIFVGLVFSGAFKNFNLFVTGVPNPQTVAIQAYVVGSAGIGVATLGIIGSKIGKRTGSVLLIISGVAMLIMFLYVGVLPGFLMLVSGGVELGKQQPSRPKPVLQKPRKERGDLLTVFLVLGIVASILIGLSFIILDIQLLFNATGERNLLTTLSMPLWTLTVYPILAILYAFSYIALYRWKKWGLYVLIPTAAMTFLLTVVTFGLRIELVSGLFGAIIIYVLIRPKWNLMESGWQDLRSHLSILLAIFGLFIMIGAIIPTANVENAVSLMPQNEVVARGGVSTDQPLVDTEIALNLTTNERLHFEIIVGRVNPPPYGKSSVVFTISNQSLSVIGTKRVYFTNDKIGLPDDYYMFWSAPENGTYYLTLHYNCSGLNSIGYDIQKVWNTEELVQVQVYRPLLAEYATPRLIVGAILTGSEAVFFSKKPTTIEDCTALRE